MKNLIRRAILCFIISGGLVQAVFAVPLLTFSSQYSSVEWDDQVSVDVVVTDLDYEFVGNFDFKVIWDFNFLSLEGIVFGDALEDSSQNSFQDWTSSDGSIDIAELSSGLLPNQDGFSDLTLFTLTFDVLGLGSSALNLEGDIGNNVKYALGDNDGKVLNADFGTGEITITQSVPESGLMGLFLLGLIGVGVGRRGSLLDNAVRHRS